MSAPKAFISYSWTSPEHGEWVIQLGNQLRENGVDVTLDKWDLKEGQDAIVFMEQMVSDPDIRKVILVLDRLYAEKADGRKGGVGTETQIISAEVYKKTDQTKFVAVIAAKDADGQPFLPTFYKSRIYIDLSDSDIYATNFEQLLRWIYDKPLHAKPSLGKPPEFLKENSIVLATETRARRAIEQIRNGTKGAAAALDEYLTTFADEIEKFRLQRIKDEPFDELVVESVAAFLPYRDEYLSVVGVLARYWPDEDGGEHLHKFLERCSLYVFRPRSISSWTETDFDNLRFIVHELFLYTVAILLRHERFQAASYLISNGYYVGEFADDRSNPIVDFEVFRNHLDSLKHRNARLKLNRTSLHADLLEQRSRSSGMPFAQLMQVDFLLFLRSSVDALKTGRRQWWPVTLLYSERQNGPFELFARAQSSAYFRKIQGLLGLSSKEELIEILSKFGTQDAALNLPRWSYSTLNVDCPELTRSPRGRKVSHCDGSAATPTVMQCPLGKLNICEIEKTFSTSPTG